MHPSKILSTVLALLIVAGTSVAWPAVPPVAFAACELAGPEGVTSVTAECTHVTVPEDYAKPAGRRIELFVARLPALSRRKSTDPLVIVAGGPGLGASTLYPGIAANLARVRRERDLLVIDQRGTGRSAPLDCEFDEQRLWEADEQETARVMRACLAKLGETHDVSQYTTSVAVRDLDSVRQALGYGTFNLYASSYGTRVAQHYARRYPATARALILDGVIPTPLVLGPSTPIDAQAALDRVFERCRSDTACSARFGDPREDYDALRTRLEQSPVDLRLPEPRTGKLQDHAFTSADFIGALRLASYGADRAALLPLMLSMAHRDERFEPLAAQYLMTASGYDAVLAYGMHNSVVCSEDVPFYDGIPLDREQLARTFLGTAQLDALRALCEGWPRGPVDDDLHAPMHSEVPALLLSGTADPVTPARYGDEAAMGFSHSVHVKLLDQGHGQIVQPCVGRVLAQFLDLAGQPASVARLDSSCLAALRPPPFFLSLGGPAP